MWYVLVLKPALQDVQACPGIQVQTDLIAVQTKNELAHTSSYLVYANMNPVHITLYQVHTKYIL